MIDLNPFLPICEIEAANSTFQKGLLKAMKKIRYRGTLDGLASNKGTITLAILIGIQRFQTHLPESSLLKGEISLKETVCHL